MDMDNQQSHDDPQFAKVLETCLKMEIETMKGNLDANMEEIKQLKSTIRSEINKRKELKRKITQMNKIKLILNDTLTKLYISINEISDTLATMKANADDQYKLFKLRSQEYQDIVAEYKKTWEEYHTMYEEFPLAKARNAAKVNLERLKIEYMITSYKKTEMTVIIKHRQRINWIRMRNKIVDFVAVMLEYLKLQEKLRKTKVNVKYHGGKLQSIEAELQVLRRKEEDQKRQRKQKMLEMAPPKINIPFREMYGHNQARARVQHHLKQIHESLDDSISVNTLFLEELCINENTVSSDRIDVERESNYELPAIEREIINSKTVISEKDDVAPTELDAKPSDEKAVSADNDVQMKETHYEEIQKSQESVKTQASVRTKESPLKHKANTSNELEAKRMRLQKQDSVGSIDKVTTSPTVVKEMDSKCSPLAVPKIKKIESVYYNISPLMPIPKPIQTSTVATSSMFSPMHLPEYCNSNMSSFDQDFISKGPLSLYEGSLCNYKLSPTSNISSICAEEDAQMAQSSNYTAEDNNTEFKDKISTFQFNNFMNNTKGNFSLF